MDEGRDATRRDAKEQSVAVEPPTEGSNAIHAAVAGRRTFSFFLSILPLFSSPLLSFVSSTLAVLLSHH